MREETYIERCRQQICETVEERTKSTSETDDLLTIPKPRREWEKHLQADVEPYARALCLKLAHSILFALPRHIRAQVYSYVLDSGSPRVTVCDGKLPRHLRSSCSHATVQSYDSFWKLADLEHYLDPSYVGPKMAREIAEAYYKAKTFYFDYHELHLLHKFFTVDRFGYGLLPTDYIRTMEVVLDGHYLCRCNRTALAHYGLIPVDSMTSEEAVRWCFEQLFMLNSHVVHIRLIVYLHEGRRMLQEFQEVLHFALPFVRRFRAQGWHVSIKSCTNHGREESIDDADGELIDQNLSKMMTIRI
ncbi:hypothetical protein BU26DRAFT_68540 [Trematosphaeria pertusa]|uniref:Uncharacterized protein n=1 Tax=Trematosphaeria pertusa TaxID=390896 RepID=A0A6A6I7C8_9PLEO|nr:uncharacterized protein BU26DRAFT_68540 [Trematosphaeria pertusa]KAF2245443.1 hypothetical protein BU26DRAFT_68540 [Trematosphaeria pertusa]